MVTRRYALLPALLLAACAAVPENGTVASGEGDASGALFVAGKFGNVLSKVDLATGRVAAQTDTCGNPHELAISPDDRHVVLACYGGAGLAIFRTSDLEQVGYIGLGQGARPHGVVWHSSGEIFATAEGRQSIYRVIDPLGRTPETHEFASGQRGTHMLAVSPDRRIAWTTDLGSRTVTRIDLSRRQAPVSVEVGEEPEGIALSPDGETLWVSARGSDKAFALDPQTLAVRAEVATGDFPLRIAIRPQGDFAVTSDLADGGLTVIDLAKGEAMRHIAVSSREEAEARTQVTILWSPDGKRIYAAETRSDTVAEVDFESGRVLRRLPGTGGGDGMAILD